MLLLREGIQLGFFTKLVQITILNWFWWQYFLLTFCHRLLKANVYNEGLGIIVVLLAFQFCPWLAHRCRSSRTRRNQDLEHFFDRLNQVQASFLLTLGPFVADQR